MGGGGGGGGGRPRAPPWSGGMGGGMPPLVPPSGYAPVNIYFNKHGIVILLKDFNSNTGVNTHMTSTFRRGVG